MNRRESKREAQRMQSDREELVERMARAIPEDRTSEVFPGLFLGRSSRLTERVHSVFRPAFCVIAQGSNQVLLGEEVFRYDPSHYLISTVDLPIVSRVVERSKERPYLSFRLNLDASLVASVLMESGIEIKKGDTRVKAMDVSSVDASMLGAVVRLARLLDTPDVVLAPEHEHG
jgi:hypothetical protein